MPHYLVLDFETTGTEPGFHEPTQVAALLLDEGLRELASFNSLIRPLHPEHAAPEALEVQGRTLEELETALPPAIVFQTLHRFVSQVAEPVVLVGHNVDFDHRFLKVAEACYGFHLERMETAPLCTCSLARVFLQAKGLVADARLGTVAAYCGIEFQAHDALGDVRATAGLLRMFKALAPGLVERAAAGRLLSGLLDDAATASPGNRFVASCAAGFRERGFLSPKQITALVRIAENRPAPGPGEVVS